MTVKRNCESKMCRPEQLRLGIHGVVSLSCTLQCVPL